ncbi:MAG: hypothetical protein WCJ70_04280 [bacterium]
MSETLTLHDVLLPDKSRGITAVFNAPIVIGPDDENYLFPREMRVNQQPGKVDATSGIGVYRLNGENKLTHLHSIPATAIQGTDRTLNPEDLRPFPLSRKKVLFGLTAATAEGVPYPACFTAEYPYTAENISPMRVLNHLPPGKNVLPLSEQTGVYREEGKENDQKLTFFRWDTGGVIRRITLPPSPWVGKDGRYGLTGGTKIAMPDNTVRMLIHGFSRRADGSVAYALGLAECKLSPDGTFDVTGVDPEPLVTYDQVKKYVQHLELVRPDPKKDAVYAVDCHLNEKGNLLIPISVDDQVVAIFEVDSERIMRPFSA